MMDMAEENIKKRISQINVPFFGTAMDHDKKKLPTDDTVVQPSDNPILQSITD